MKTKKKMPKRAALRALARLLGVDAGQLSKESKREGFPRAMAGRFGVAAVRTWREHNINIRKDAPPAAAPLTAADEVLLAVLKNPASSALEKARSAVGLASNRVASAAAAGVLGGRDLDGLHASLGELRKSEGSYLELAERTRLVIDREEAKELIGKMIARMVRTQEILEISLCSEVDVWLADSSFRDLPADIRRARIREWVRAKAYSLRNGEADVARALINGPDDMEI